MQLSFNECEYHIQVGATVNRGKDFTRDTVEILATADPGAYVAFAAIPLDLYKRGLNDGLNHWTVCISLYRPEVYLVCETYE